MTFLFTDAVGHTELWREHPAAASVALARHDEILRSAIGRHGGVVFTTAGDSFAAAFAVAGDAVAAAVDAQDSLAAEMWPEPIEISVRMGLNTGIAEVRDSDFFGLEVIRAARIEAAAHGGQILVSPSTAALLARSDLLSLGLHRLKDFDESVELFQVGRGLFPPIRTLTPRRNNLSRQVVDLIGRDAEVARLLDLTDDARLVTVTGPGGIGKTSLAAAVARRLSARAGVEVWWCGLSAVGSDDVVFRVAETVGLRTGTSDPIDVARMLAQRDAVWVVLDNCEHVAEAVAGLVDVLMARSEVHVIATSRLPLDVVGEAVVALGPLTGSRDAVELFVRHASGHGVNLDVAKEEEVIDRICRRVDGIPLAIVLIAAHTRALSLADIEDRSDRLLLAGGRGGSDGRHRTMAVTIEWSVDLLDEHVAAALGELSVFAGSFGLGAAEAILEPVLDVDPIFVIEELVANSLMQTDTTSGTVRYRLLEPIRQYASVHLWRHPSTTKDRHLEYYLERLEEAYAILASKSSEPMQALIELDMDNLGAVHAWALRSGRVDDDLRLYRPLMLADAHEVFEPGEWARRTLATPGIEEHERWREALAKAFQTSTFKSFWTLNAESIELLNRLRNAGPGVGSDLVEAQLAWIECTREQRHSEGVDRWDAIETDDPFTIYLRYLISPPSHAVSTKDRDAARAEFRRGIDWARSIGARSFESAFLAQAAFMEQLFGNPQAAYDLAEKAIALTAHTHMKHLEAGAILCRVNAVLAGVSSPHEPLADALHTLRSAMRSGAEVRLVMALVTAARLLELAGRVDAAALAAIGAESVSNMMGRRVGPQRIPAEAVERARDRRAVEDLTVSDIAARSIIELVEIGSSPDRFRSESMKETSLDE